jgi:hypothetical protein
MDSKCQTTTMLLPLSPLNGRNKYLHQTSRKKKKQQEDVKTPRDCLLMIQTTVYNTTKLKH